MGQCVGGRECRRDRRAAVRQTGFFEKKRKSLLTMARNKGIFAPVFATAVSSLQNGIGRRWH